MEVCCVMASGTTFIKISERPHFDLTIIRLALSTEHEYGFWDAAMSSILLISMQNDKQNTHVCTSIQLPAYLFDVFWQPYLQDQLMLVYMIHA